VRSAAESGPARRGGGAARRAARAGARAANAREAAALPAPPPLRAPSAGAAAQNPSTAPAMRARRLALLLATFALAAPAPAPLAPATGCVNDCGALAAPARGRCVTPLGGGPPTCECAAPFAGGAADCSARACPLERAWWAPPVSASRAHDALAPCAGVGDCRAAADGACACAAGFEGAACARAACPRGCSGRGVCRSMRAAARKARNGGANGAFGVAYGEGAAGDDWAADRAHGCVCDAGWRGADCATRACPVGADPGAAGGFEVQAVTTRAGEGAREVQVLVLGAAGVGGGGSGGGADVDEVQTIIIAGHMGEPPNGTFSLALDARAGGCALWDDARRVAGATAPIALLAGEPAADVAARVAAALGALPSIGGADQLTVAGALVLDQSVDAWYRYEIAVTFAGANVGGDVAPLALAILDMTPAPWLLLRGVDETVRGSELRGAWGVAYDDTAAWSVAADLASAACADGGDGAAGAAWAAAPLGVTATDLAVNATNDALARRLTELLFGCPRGALNASYAGAGAAACAAPPPRAGGAVAVAKEGTGGPGYALVVTFLAGLRVRGNVAPLALLGAGDARGLTAVALATDDYAGVDGFAPEGSVATRADGSQVGGWLSLTPPRRAAGPAGWEPAPAAVAVPWCASAATVAAALQAAEDAAGYGLGIVRVSRARAYAPGRSDADGWAGSYTWAVSFPSVAEDIPLLLGAALGAAGLADGAVVATPDASVAVTEVAAGSWAAPANEVQLVDCACGAAGCAAGDGVALTWRGATTARIPAGADAAAVRLALAALPALPDVRVRMYGGATLCSAGGTTTAVTFSHSPGPQPPLLVARAADAALPAGAALALRLAPALGAYGGAARRGRRALLECSGRGACAPATGRCTCDRDAAGRPYYGPSDGGGGPDAEPGDGSALPFWAPAKVADNCGRVLPRAGLPVACLCASPAAGACAPGSAVCVCAPGRSGARCELAACPVARASLWDVPRLADEARGPLLAHAPAECGGVGTCAPAAGASACACAPGWGGAACELGPCPGAPAGAGACAGGEPCVTLGALSRGWELAGAGAGSPLLGRAPAFEYAGAWDAEMLRGCVCAAPPGGAAYRGPAAFNWGTGGGAGCAAARACPGGADPLAAKAAYAPRAGGNASAAAAGAAARAARASTQRLACNLTVGALTLRFRGEAARALAAGAVIFDAQADARTYTLGGESLETALRSLHLLGATALRVLSAGGDGALAAVAPAGTAAALDPATGAAFPRALCAGGAAAVDITFLPTGAAPPPLLRADVDAAGRAAGDWATVTEVAAVDAAAAAAWRECNARGVCDGATGRCACADGFASSDGAGGAGQRGDCGHEVRAWGEARAARPQKRAGAEGVFK